VNKNQIIDMLKTATGESEALLKSKWDRVMPIKWDDIDYSDMLFRAFVEDYTDCVIGLNHKNVFKNVLWCGESEIVLSADEKWL
jgi:hypothetical protein